MRRFFVFVIALAAFVGWGVAGFFLMCWLDGRTSLYGLATFDVVMMAAFGAGFLFCVALIFGMFFAVVDAVVHGD